MRIVFSLCLVFVTLLSAAEPKLNINRFFGHAWNPANLPKLTTQQQQIFLAKNEELFNQFTIAGGGNWRVMERTRDSMNWTTLDSLKALCIAQGLEGRSQSMTGRDGFTPDWICTIKDSLTFQEEFRDWISAFFGRYGAIFPSVNIFNEPVGWANDKQGRPCWADIVGGDGESGYDWLIWAASEVNRFTPEEVCLTINENRVLNSNSRREKFMKMNRLLIKRGLIKEIGVQAHGLESVSASTIKTSLDTFANLGLPVRITELTVNIKSDASQLNWYKTRFPVLWEHPAVIGLTQWSCYEPIVWKDRPYSYLINEDGTERPALAWLREYLGIGKEMAPAAPTTIRATPGHNRIALRWMKNNERDLAGYYVLRGAAKTGPFVKISTLIDTNHFVDSTALNGAPCYYVLQAIDTLGALSENSEVVESTPVASGVIYGDPLTRNQFLTGGKTGRVMIYDIAGRKIGGSGAAAGVRGVPRTGVQRTGVYIVRAGSRTMRVLRVR